MYGTDDAGLEWSDNTVAIETYLRKTMRKHGIEQSRFDDLVELLDPELQSFWGLPNTNETRYAIRNMIETIVVHARNLGW